MGPDPIIEATRQWIARVVIGLNLCPFAQRVFNADKIRYVVSAATSEPSLRTDLRHELAALAAAPMEDVETTLLIHPHVFADFFDYNDFLNVADDMLAELGLEGSIQVASFHPQYQFAETTADAVENYTNRSPYPMLHLLREESIAQLDWTEEELLAIPERNIATLRALGLEAILARCASKEE